MSSTISFTSGATTVTFDGGRKYPEEPHRDLRQIRMRAMGGRLVSVTLDPVALDSPVIHLRITDAKKAELENFIFSTVVGGANAFTFTDHDQSTKTVKYMGGLEEAKRVGSDRWAIALKLVEVT